MPVIGGVVFCRQIFCDFGAAFTVADTDGEQPTTVMVAGITKVIPASRKNLELQNAFGTDSNRYFRAAFIVADTDGEQPASVMVANITI